jgi:hypothetical protein
MIFMNAFPLVFRLHSILDIVFETNPTMHNSIAITDENETTTTTTTLTLHDVLLSN